MTHRYGTLGLLGVLALGLPSASGATDQQTFARLIGKVAPAFALGQKITPKVACVCHESVQFARPGFVLTDGAGLVKCGVPGFTADGTADAITFCNDFVALGH
jgi:hypothetical protein